VRLTPAFILLIVAVILFLVDAIGIKVGSISVVSLGLAAFAGSFLVAGRP
jgi:hypothetical protein